MNVIKYDSCFETSTSINWTGNGVISLTKTQRNEALSAGVLQNLSILKQTNPWWVSNALFVSMTWKLGQKWFAWTVTLTIICAKIVYILGSDTTKHVPLVYVTLTSLKTVNSYCSVFRQVKRN